MFIRFKVGNTGLYVSHLQYANETLFIGETLMENLWSLKVILGNHEHASSLKVKILKAVSWILM
jgi:hypothetical protein